MRLKLVFSAATLLGLSVGLVRFAGATPVDFPYKIKNWGPTYSIDLGRAVTGIVQGIIALTGDGAAKAELIAIQEQINENADGTAGWDTIPTGMAEPTDLQNDVYSYVKRNILDQTDLSKYSVLQRNLSAPKGEGNARETCESLGFRQVRQKQTCMAVIDTFFADKGKYNTQKYQDKILSQRQAYAQKITERHIELGYNVQRRAITDLAAAARAPVSKDNEIAEIAVDGQTLDEMLKITVADLALQIEMMEADALNFMLQQPVEMMPSEKPAEE